MLRYLRMRLRLEYFELLQLQRFEQRHVEQSHVGDFDALVSDFSQGADHFRLR